MISSALMQTGVQPASYFEIGPGVGRVFYEVARRHGALQRAHLIEPTGPLRQLLQTLFQTPDLHALPHLSAAGGVVMLNCSTLALHDQISHVDITLEPTTAGSTKFNDKVDLTVCLNVLDQVVSPAAIITLCDSVTRPLGILAISSTGQWQRDKVRCWDEVRCDIEAYFGPRWRKLDIADLEYKVRRNERHAWSFISQTLILQKRE